MQNWTVSRTFPWAFLGRGSLTGVTSRALFTVVLVAMATSPRLAAQRNSESDGAKQKRGDVVVTKAVTAEDIGLPIYPGARPYKGEDDDSSGGKLSAAGRFRFVVIKLESDDPAGKVAAFYRQALAKYGRVLECSNPQGKNETASKSSADTACDEDDEPEEGGFLLKAGAHGKQHVVGIRPNGNRCDFALIYLEGAESGK